MMKTHHPDGSAAIMATLPGYGASMTNEERDALLAASPSPDRVTKDYIESIIRVSSFFRPTQVLTICVLELANGFTVTGESACADPANYRQDLGEKIAYDMAFDKIWALEGYLLKQRLYLRSR